MIKKIKIIIVITLMLIATNMIYILLHELGHCLVAFLCGASITDFSIINRSMSFTGMDCCSSFKYVWNCLSRR